MGSGCMEIVSRTFCHLTILAGFSIFHFPAFNSFGRQSIACPCCWQRLNFAFNCFIIHKVPPFWHCRWPRWPPSLPLCGFAFCRHTHTHTDTLVEVSAVAAACCLIYERVASFWLLHKLCQVHTWGVAWQRQLRQQQQQCRNALHPPELRQPQQSQSQTLPGLCCMRAAEMLINFIKIALLIWFAVQRGTDPNRLPHSSLIFSFPGSTRG